MNTHAQPFTPSLRQPVSSPCAKSALRTIPSSLSRTGFSSPATRLKIPRSVFFPTPDVLDSTPAGMPWR